MKNLAVWLALLALLLAGCGRFGSTPAALPTVVLDPGGAVQDNATPGQDTVGEPPSRAELAASGAAVTASGVIAPARQVNIATAQGGIVEEVFVAAGEQVQAGKILVRMAGSEQLTAAVETAQTELLAAQQDLQRLQESIEQDRAAALLRLASANKALDEAKKVRGYRQYRNGSDAMISTARADVILANDALQHAQEAYNGVSDRGDADVVKAGALSALSAAQKAYNRAVANLNYLTAMPNQIDVDLAEAQLQAAQSEVDAAQRDYTKLEQGPDLGAMALAEQRIRSAEARLAASNAAFRSVELTAPFGATVAELNTDPGAWVTPGQPLLVLADLTHLQVRTTDLSERDIPSVLVGQPVVVYVKALDLELDGRVNQISPLAETLGGDVVYTAVIDLQDAQPVELRAGMSAEVQFLSGLD